MALHFFDSSAVAKRYHPESGSGKVMTIFAEMQKEIRISQLSFVEVQSVFAMKVRSGFLDRKDAGMQRARFLEWTWLPATLTLSVSRPTISPALSDSLGVIALRSDCGPWTHCNSR